MAQTKPSSSSSKPSWESSKPTAAPKGMALPSQACPTTTPPSAKPMTASATSYKTSSTQPAHCTPASSTRRQVQFKSAVPKGRKGKSEVVATPAKPRRDAVASDDGVTASRFTQVDMGASLREGLWSESSSALRALHDSRKDEKLRSFLQQHRLAFVTGVPS